LSNKYPPQKVTNFKAIRKEEFYPCGIFREKLWGKEWGGDRENGAKGLADYSKRKSNQVKWTITGTRRDETFVQIICCGQARSAAVKFITLASDQWS